MNVILFYQRLVTLMNEYEDGEINKEDALASLEDLRQEAKTAGIPNVRVSDKIFDQIEPSENYDSYQSSY